MANGINDTVLLWTIVTVFLILGLALPYIQESFSPLDSTNSTSNTLTLNRSQILDDMPTTANPVTLTKVVLSIIKMFFWTFGDIPIWLDAAVFEPMRIILYIIAYRLIRSGSG